MAPRNMIVVAVVLAACGSVVIACGSIGVTRLKQATSKEYDCDLDVYTRASKVTRPYDELCLIDVRTGSSVFDDKTIAGAINEAKPAACRCGADAIILMGGDTQADLGYGHGTAIITAIRFTRAERRAGDAGAVGSSDAASAAAAGKKQAPGK